MIKAIIFDMDGVLIDAKDWHYEALNRALRLFGCEISRYDHLATFDGLPTKEKLNLLSKERHLPEKLHSFINEMKQRYTWRSLRLNANRDLIINILWRSCDPKATEWPLRPILFDQR